MRRNYRSKKRGNFNSTRFQQQLIRAILVLGSLMLLIIFFFGDHGLYQLYQLRSEKEKIQSTISFLREKKQNLAMILNILNSLHEKGIEWQKRVKKCLR